MTRHQLLRPASTMAIIAMLSIMMTGCPDKKADPRLIKLADDLHLFAGGDAIADGDRAAALTAVTGTDEALSLYIDSLLAPAMSDRFVKDLMVSATTPVKDRHPLPYGNVLRQTKSHGTTVNYLRAACEASDSVPVTPWWDDDGESIQVCPDAYRPDVRTDAAGRTCGASMLDPSDSDVCGCGPMLVFCLKDSRQRRDFKNLIVQEVQDTVGYVVNNDRPIDDAFTMNETIGNIASEYLYRRARVVSGEDPKTLFPIKGYGRPALRPRHEQIPGQHAGVLSTPMMVYPSDALRGVMRNYFEYLWCTGIARSSVQTDAVLALKKVDLRVGDGWKELASMNICTNCHAKLDYGMQFFWGYPSSTMGVDFNIANIRHGDGPLYGDSIKDHRGDAPLTPAGFARLATAQPEFSACMTKKVVDHVFNGSSTSADVNVIGDAFSKRHNVKDTLRAAMLRYAKRVRQEVKATPTPAVAPATPPPPSPAPAPGTDGAIAVSPALQKLLHKHCRDCHGSDDPYPLTTPTLPPHDLALILDRVAFGAMPKDIEGIDDDVRRSFITETASLLFTDATEREASILYYADTLKAAPTHRFLSALENVRAAADSDSRFRPSGTETAVAQSLQDYSPGIGLAQAVTAMAACKDKGSPDDVQRCVDKATAPSLITTGLP